MKILVSFFLLFFCSSLLAGEIKLTCNIDAVNMSIYGDSRETGIADIVINDEKEYILISLDSNISFLKKIIAITKSFKDNDTQYISVNLSDKNKFDIHTKALNLPNRRKYTNITQMETETKIDRNTGNLYVYRETNFSDMDRLITKASGNCSKVNLTIRKF
jgi:hypothetical protein